MGVSLRASRAQAGARARRAARKNRRGAERCRGAIAGSLHARGYPLLSRGVRCRPRPPGASVWALLIQRIAPSGMSVDPYAVMLAYLALTLAYLGYIDQARSRMDEALSEARRLGHVHTLAHVLALRDLDSTRSPARLWCTSEEFLALSTEHGFPFYLGLGTGIPRTVVDRGRASTGRPCAAHAGAGGTACYRSRCKYADAVHVARRGLRHARAAC